MKYFVYVIKSLSRPYTYVGISDNIERRFSQHNLGHNKTTKPYIPFQLLVVEEYAARIDARQREKYLKSGVGREYIKSLVQ